jgi:hypothetical protein
LKIFSKPLEVDLTVEMFSVCWQGGYGAAARSSIYNKEPRRPPGGVLGPLYIKGTSNNPIFENCDFAKSIGCGKEKP